MEYRGYGTASLQEYLGERVVYRNLIPSDRRLPSLADLDGPLRLGGRVPRKAEPDYGQVVAEMLRQARRLTLTGGQIEWLLFIGDTALNDGTAYRNIRAAGGWRGRCFIGRDALNAPETHNVEGEIYSANRWSALPVFLSYVQEVGCALDERTAVVLDIDKTTIGARGRNDRVIDEARVEGVERTVTNLLGGSFDRAAFRAAYEELNQPPYYGLTADNQDYLAYICLSLGASLYRLEDIVEAVESGTLRSFERFIGDVQDRREELARSGLTSVHDEVWARVRAGDPTPFKAFRYNEYLTTVARFGALPGVSPETFLRQRIAITQEVREAALLLQERGALLFGLSDKPDEASLPSEAQARAGMLPLHALETLAIGAVESG
jgi:hypothetical protein